MKTSRLVHAVMVMAGTAAVTGAPGWCPAHAQDTWLDGVLDLANLDGTNGFVINGIDADDRSGYSVSSAGDVNGDGFDDVIIGAHQAASSAGESYVVFGGGGIGSSGAIELDTLNGVNGFVVNGTVTAGSAGQSVAGGGDVNGDGIDDVIIGAPGADPNGIAYGGESYVVFGGSSVGSSGSLDAGALNGTNGFVINGIDAGDVSGQSVSFAGDINADGIDDLIIGASGRDPNGMNRAGETYVVFGGGTTGHSGSFELSSIDGTNGFALVGIDERDYSGLSVSSAGDVNGDGVDDVIIGAPGTLFYQSNGGPASGEAYVIFGGSSTGSTGSIDLSTLDGANGFVLDGINSSDGTGFSVSSAGDVNDDGVDDLIVGARLASPNGNVVAGECYVIFGGIDTGNSGSVNLGALDGTNGFVLEGFRSGSEVGVSVDSAGDVNGDGVDDLIIGAHGDRGQTGASYVIFGGDSTGNGGSIDLDTLDGINGFALNGSDFFGGSGWSVASAGDVNGDGLDDLIVGGLNFLSGPGESYVIFGIDTTAMFLDADFNQDGIVDLLDLDILGQNWETSGATNATGDANGYGEVNLVDLDLLGQQWEQASSFDAALAASGIPVPEPGMALLVGGGLAAMGRRRSVRSCAI